MSAQMPSPIERSEFQRHCDALSRLGSHAENFFLVVDKNQVCELDELQFWWSLSRVDMHSDIHSIFLAGSSGSRAKSITSGPASPGGECCVGASTGWLSCTFHRDKCC